MVFLLLVPGYRISQKFFSIFEGKIMGVFDFREKIKKMFFVWVSDVITECNIVLRAACFEINSYADGFKIVSVSFRCIW